MAYTLIIDDQQRIAKATYHPDTSYQDRVDLLNELIGLLKEEPTLAVLIDIRCEAEELSPEEQIQYGRLLAENGHYFRDNRTAVLTKHNPNPLIPGEAYAKGFRNLVEFDNEADAYRWLRRETS